MRWPNFLVNLDVLPGCYPHHLPASTFWRLSSQLSLVPKHGVCLHILEPWCYLMLKRSEEFECWGKKGENCAAPKKLWTINGDALCMGWPSPRSPSRALQSLGLHLDLHVSIFGGYVDCELRWNQTHEHQAKEPHLMSKRKHFTLHSS